MEKIVIIGNGGHAKSIMDSIENLGVYEIVGFIATKDEQQFEYRGYRIIGTDDDLELLYKSGIHKAFVGIGYMGKGNVREKIYDRLKKIGYTLPAIIDPSAIIASDAQIGEGTYIGKRAVVNSAAKVGKMAIINTGAIVEHDCIVGDFAHVAVNVTLCGGVFIGRSCFIGANAVVIQNIVVEDNSLIGAGAVVVNDIEDNCVAVGVPAKIVKKLNN